MAATYVFVCDTRTRTFPERHRVLEEGEVPSQGEIARELPLLTGTISEAGADSLLEALRRRYEGSRYEVERVVATRWATVQRNYYGLRYEID